MTRYVFLCRELGAIGVFHMPIVIEAETIAEAGELLAEQHPNVEPGRVSSREIS